MSKDEGGAFGTMSIRTELLGTMTKRTGKKVFIIKPSYLLDSNYLIRLSNSILTDESKTLEWRKRVISLITELVLMFQGDSNVVSGIQGKSSKEV